MSVGHRGEFSTICMKMERKIHQIRGSGICEEYLSERVR